MTLTGREHNDRGACEGLPKRSSPSPTFHHATPEALAFRLVVDDGQGGACTGAVNVGVPPSRRPGLGARDDGQRYDSTQP
jgi:hypothetical protein